MPERGKDLFGAGLFVCVMCVVDVAMSVTGRDPKPAANEEPLEPLSVAAVAWAFALVGTIALLKLTDLVVGVRASEDQETEGLDLTEHGEEAYNLEM